MKVIAYTDPIGTFIGDTQEDDYRNIENEMRTILNLGGSMSFEKDVSPDELNNVPFDIYVIDFGGILPGADMLVGSTMRELEKKIEDYPNSLFIFWTRMTVDKYAQYIRKEIGEVFDLGNVVIRDSGDNWKREVNQWVSL